VLSVLAHTVCAALRRRLPGYGTATWGTSVEEGLIQNHE